MESIKFDVIKKLCEDGFSPKYVADAMRTYVKKNDLKRDPCRCPYCHEVWTITVRETHTDYSCMSCGLYESEENCDLHENEGN